ncbi:uncharacterized protein LOC132259265 [Phlebotomus argentipes]|uniref:uncharacterized protein LOC132259265 n=1 Tax=Phlebotomus argentipes TaxID=94469 RepID=UPI00289364E1|nr:uncharacterized protein LOC132259265 [Phlebotomus argentipes]
MLLWSDIVFLLGGLALLVYYFFKRKFSYWAKLGVPHANPSFPYGNIGDVGKKLHTTELFQQFYREFKGKTPLMGFYATAAPQVLLLDLDLIQRIFIKDFQYFHDRAQYYNLEDDPISAHLFNIDGERWKILRAKISPTFTSGKMKMMLPTMIDVAQNFHETLFQRIQDEAEIEVKDYLSRFTTDVIGSCAFGIECNSLQDPKTKFRVLGDKAFATPWWKVIRFNFASSFISLARKLHIRVTDKDVSEFYTGVVNSTVKYREENGVQRNDFLNLLMQLRDRGSLDGEAVNESGKLTLDEIVAQSFVFFLAGYETSSTAMTFALYELAKHPEIQERARQNVRDSLAKYGGKFTYDAAMEMTYLDQVINETMRKFPPLGSLTRRITHDYQVPGTKYVLKKNLRVIIPIHSIQNDPDIFPDPDKFDPDRFSVEKSRNRHNAAFMPFGDGPRNCIGLRFGMMQVRVGLATILRHFHVSRCSRTPDPPVVRKDNFTLSSEGGMWLTLRRVSECQNIFKNRYCKAHCSTYSPRQSGGERQGRFQSLLIAQRFGLTLTLSRSVAPHTMLSAITILLSVIAPVVLLWWYVTHSFKYWQRRGIRTVKPKFPLGNGQTGKTKVHFSVLFATFYNQLKSSDAPFGGIYLFTRPIALALKLDFVRDVLIRDFQHFSDRGIFYNEQDDPLSANLFTLTREKWSVLRAKLTPTFTTGRMKEMAILVASVAQELQSCLRTTLVESSTVEIKDLMTRFTTDVIGSCAFGIHCNSLRDPESTFGGMAKKVVQPANSRLQQLFMTAFPAVARFLHMRTFDRQVTSFFRAVVEETMRQRDLGDSERRNDFIDLLMKLRDDNASLTADEIAAQALIFFSAGFETSSSTLTFCLYELAVNEAIQRRVREEIEAISSKYDNQITYESLSEMKYLDRVINETLRKYPPLASLFRRVTQTYSSPEGGELAKDMNLIIPIYAIHHDPDIYEQPEVFNPDRFEPEAVSRRHRCAFLPFGDGPRNCIGLRFGLMQTKIGLAALLRRFVFSPSATTPRSISFTRKSLTLTPDGGLWLNVVELV